MLLTPYWYAASGGGGTDPNFAAVVLLCHFDGANGATTFVDSSSKNHSMSRFSPTVLTTAQQQFGTASLDVLGGLVYTVAGADVQFGTGQFTVEAFIRPTAAISGVVGLVTVFGGSSNLGWFFGFNGNTLNFFYSTTGTDNPVVTGAYTPTLNTWVHVAADRDASNVLRVYANGAVIASAAASAGFFASTQNTVIGNDWNTTRPLVGQIDEVRITKGVARYGGAFTPPTAPFPNS